MTDHEIAVELHRILDAHDEALLALRQARQAHEIAFRATDDVLVSAITANRAAIHLLNRLLDEGVSPDV